jgi:hypothetical protein
MSKWEYYIYLNGSDNQGAIQQDIIIYNEESLITLLKGDFIKPYTEIHIVPSVMVVPNDYNQLKCHDQCICERYVEND